MSSARTSPRFPTAQSARTNANFPRGTATGSNPTSTQSTAGPPRGGASRANVNVSVLNMSTKRTTTTAIPSSGPLSAFGTGGLYFANGYRVSAASTAATAGLAQGSVVQFFPMQVSTMGRAPPSRIGGTSTATSRQAPTGARQAPTAMQPRS